MDNTKRIVNKTLLDDIADAIREKEGSSESIVASTFPERILGIETGTDMSDATATVDDILEGKTAYLSDGTKQSGTIQTWDGTIVGDFEYAYPYGDFDAIIAGTGSIYSGYCPSIIRSNVFGAIYGGPSFLREFCPTFSSNWSLISVGSAAFMSQSNLTKVDFLSSSCYKTLENSTFYTCTLLSTPMVNVISTGASCFENCYSLPYFSTIYSGTVSLGGWGMELAGFSYVYISCQRLNLGRGACGNLYSCSSISFNVTGSISVNGAEFLRCSAISEMSLTRVANNGTTDSMFSGCINLREVSISMAYNAQTYYRNNFFFRSYCFADCSSLSKISIAGYARMYVQVSYSAFKNCYNLKEINFELLESTESTYCSLGGWAFENCSSLLSLSGVLSKIKSLIPQSAFAGCTNFKFFKTELMLSDIYNNAFTNCTNLSFYFSPSLGTIRSSAFKGCSSLKSLVLNYSGNFGGGPKSDAFKDSGLQSLYLFSNGALYTLEASNAFSNTPIADSTYLGYYGSIYVPASQVESYKAATNWAFYSDRIVGVTDEEAEAIIQAFQNTSYVEVTENE